MEGEVVVVFGEEEGAEAGGRGGGEEGKSVGKGGEGGGGRGGSCGVGGGGGGGGGEEGEEGEGEWGGDGGGEAGEAGAEGCGTGIVGEDGGGGGEDGQEARAGFVTGDLGVLHAPDEDGEVGYEVVRQGFVVGVETEGSEEAREDGVGLVVGAACVGGEAEDADVAGADVVEDGAEAFGGADDDVAGGGGAAGDVDAAEAGEGSFGYLHEVAFFKGEIAYVVEGQGVAHGGCYASEGVHGGVGDDGIGVRVVRVHDGHEGAVYGAEGADLCGGGAHEDVLVGECAFAAGDAAVVVGVCGDDGGEEFDGTGVGNGGVGGLGGVGRGVGVVGVDEASGACGHGGMCAAVEIQHVPCRVFVGVLVAPDVTHYFG